MKTRNVVCNFVMKLGSLINGHEEKSNLRKIYQIFGKITINL